MDIMDFAFMFSILVMLVITLYKIFNLISGNKLYDFKMSVILFIGYLFMWFLALQSVLHNPTQEFYLGLFDMAGLLLIANAFIFVTELFLMLYQITSKPTEAYYSNRN